MVLIDSSKPENIRDVLYLRFEKNVEQSLAPNILWQQEPASKDSL